jgi:hypothetical protein
MNGRLRDEVRRRRSKLWDEHDLAARIERHDGAMRFSGRGQWQLCSDDRLDVPCRELLAQRLVDSAQLLSRGVRENQSANIRISHHGITRVYFHTPAASDNDDTTAPSQQLQVRPEVDIGKHFENAVYSALLRRP